MFIDLDGLDEGVYGISSDEFLTLLLYYLDVDNCLDSLLSKGFLESTLSGICISKEGVEKVKSILKTKDGRLSKICSNELARKMKDNYIKGKSANGFSYATSIASIKERMNKFYEKYGYFSDEEIIDAEKRYIKDMKNNNRDMYICKLDYFIFKNDQQFGSTKSPLMEYLDNKNLGKETQKSGLYNGTMMI